MIINSSNNLYVPPGGGGSVETEIALSLALAGDLDVSVQAPQIPVEIGLSIALSGDVSTETETRQVRRSLALAVGVSGDLQVQAQSEHSINLSLSLNGDLIPSVRLALVQPEPITPEIGEDAFDKPYYTARLLDNTSAEIEITDATIEAPKAAVGKRVSITVAKKDLSLITPDKTYTFQVGTRPTPLGTITWEPIIQNAPMVTRNFSRGINGNLPADTLSFGAIETLKDRLNRFPIKSRIYYNSNKTEVDLSTLEKIYDTAGEEIQTLVFQRSSLDLYYILKQIKAILGFDSIETNLPNFELASFFLSYTQSYLQAISGVIGIFEPIYFTVGNTLWILDKSAALPDDFAPRAIVPSNITNWQCVIPEASPLDGYELNYIDSNTTADTFVDRLIQTTEETGTYGEADFTRTEINTTWRDWKNSSDLTQVLRSDLIREVHSTYDNLLNLTARETNTHTYDFQGKRTNSSRTREARVPDLENSGAAALLTVKRETQSVFYTSDPRSARRVMQSKVITQVRGLIAVDSENTYFDEDGNQVPYKKDFEKVHEAGNLTLSMTTEFGLISTVQETLTPLGNNQYEVRYSGYDHLLNKPINPLTEPKTGDVSLSAIGGRSRKKVVWRPSVTQATRTGNAVEPISAGELPYVFAKPLLERKLVRRDEGKQSGGINIIGYHSSIDRGVFLTILDRDGENSLGKFIAEGYRVNFNNINQPGQQRVTTDIEVSEI